jgi:hypothetical protein
VTSHGCTCVTDDIKLVTRVIDGPPVKLRCECGTPLIVLRDDLECTEIGCPDCCDDYLKGDTPRLRVVT